MKKITDYSIQLIIVFFMLFLLGLGFLTGYCIKGLKEKPAEPTEDINHLKKMYYLKGASKMLELRNSPYNTQNISDRFKEEFDNEFKK